MKILIPIGGKGLRFKNSGYTMPKPLIEVDGVPIIFKVLDSIDLLADMIYVVREDHCQNYKIDQIINERRPGTFYKLSRDNDGQVETCLLASDSIDDGPLLIVNCDNYLLWNEEGLEDLIRDPSIDGAAFTFTDTSNRTHWCFAETEGRLITRLVEKEKISDIALAGAFYWRRGSDFVKYANQLVVSNVRAKNGEFYLGSVFNLAIKDGKRVVNHPIVGMKSLGTPEELEAFNSWTLNKKSESNTMTHRNVQNAVDDLLAGKPIVLIDEHDRENEGDIVIAAEKANRDNLVFTMNKARGLMCLPCDGAILDRLAIGPMVSNNTDRNQTPFTVSIDASSGTTTGMSVDDRLRTISVLVDPESSEADLTRPGHLFPLRPRNGLLKERRGHTEGSIELMKLAGLKPVSIICEIMNDDGSMAKGGELNKFATENGLTIISIEELYETIYGESL
jgi:3,4-dihydroxy-2-butanone 4-phosphate synthase